MKKLNVLLSASVLALALVGCAAVEDDLNAIKDEIQADIDEAKDDLAEVKDEITGNKDEQDAEETEQNTEETESVMTYAEYLAADVDTEVVIECYVQATQSWWDNKITVYAADEDGAYFIYNMTCSEEDAAKLTEGVKIKVNGFKSVWAGEIEVAEGATFEFEDGNYVSGVTNVTEFIGTDDLANYMNQKVGFVDMTVEAVSYKNDTPGDDIYVTLSKDGVKVEFCLEYYLNGSDEDFYATVGNLEVGSVVDAEGFLYWYEGANPHITAVTVK